MKRDAHLKKPIPGLDRIPFWKRFLAFAIDILVFELIVAMPLSSLLPETFTVNPTPLLIGVVIVATTLFFSYLVISQYLIGQTLGMLFMRYRVKNHNQLWRCIVRNVFIIPVFPFIVLWVVDPLVLAFTGDRLTERWSGATSELV